MQDYTWKHLNRHQLGRYAEYFVKMELTRYGLQVFTPEIDDHGIDLVARFPEGPFWEFQVKALSGMGYVFMRKRHFPIIPGVYCTLALIQEQKQPELYLIPAMAWLAPNELLRDRDYKGKKSEPEWGINISNKNMPLLAPFAFDKQMRQMIMDSKT